MAKNSINKTEPKQDSLVFNAFEKIDYRDAFLISFEKNRFKNKMILQKDFSCLNRHG